MDKITALISDIRSGKNVKVTADDLAWIRENLKDPENDNLHQFARGLGHIVQNPGEKDIELIENIIKAKKDDYAMQGAIYTLCDYWNLAPRYINDLLVYMDLNQWNDYYSAAIATFSAVGSYLHNKNDKSVAVKLLQIVQHDIALKNNNSELFDDIHLDCAIDAILKSLYGRRNAFFRRNDYSFPYTDLLSAFSKKYKL